MGDNELVVMSADEDDVKWLASADDIAAHVAALPHDEAVALIRAVLRARTDDAAVEAVDTAKVARGWTNTGERWPLDRGVSAAAEVYTNGYSAGWVVYRPTLDEYEEHAGEGAAKDAADAALRADGWVLVGGAR